MNVRKTGSWRLLGPLLVVLTIQCGCSWTWVASPAAARENQDEGWVCTKRSVHPYIDGAIAIVSGIVGAVQVYAGAADSSQRHFIAIGLVQAGVGGVFALSARSGFQWTRECRSVAGD